MGLKVSFISDTHGDEPSLPGGDLLIHCGDLSIHGFRVEVVKALNYLHEQKEKYKEVVLIPGNHDFFAQRHPKDFQRACQAAGLHLLLNQSLTLFNKTLWGSPVTPFYHNWAFNLDKEAIKKHWEQIPACDILITHTPPYQILDKNHKGEELGCPYLLKKVKDLKPKIHTFGHVHESHGVIASPDTLFINSATHPQHLEID